jgi:hypothetical protein
MNPNDDWRVANATHLKAASFRWKKYYRWSESWTHDHCAACRATFSLVPGDLDEGYAVNEEDIHGADYHWVCKTCFDDLREIMEWKVI